MFMGGKTRKKIAYQRLSPLATIERPFHGRGQWAANAINAGGAGGRLKVAA